VSGAGALPAFPDPLTLPALQDYVARMVAARGFTQELDRVFVLWVEELGELAEHLWAGPAAPDARELGAELADVTLYLADLANGLGVDLERAVGAALPEPGSAGHPSAVQPSVVRPVADAPLSAWQARAAGLPEASVGGPAGDSAQRAALGLQAAAGQVARVLRKRWSGLDGGAARPLAEALACVLRLANGAGVDLTRAIAEKERENAGRTWTY
jgi:NTP pyrophosphatase (non-canonical NTP hydrolase)